MAEEKQSEYGLKFSEADKYKGFEVNSWRDVIWMYGNRTDDSFDLSEWNSFQENDVKKGNKDNQNLEGETYYIVDNSNKEMPIRVVDSDRILLNFNSLLPVGVKPTNKIDSRLRDLFYRQAHFKKQDYDKYDMVKVQDDNEDIPKRHFIKQKQE